MYSLTNFFTFFRVVQEPSKEDLTVSEKFQLVLDVAQKAQVQHVTTHTSVRSKRY